MHGGELYARGSKSLRAELEVLKARGSEDAFIADVRDIEARLRQLKTIEFDTNSVRVFHADGEMIVAEKPFALKKNVIVTLAAIFGVMF